MYEKNVYLLDLCIFAYHLHAQTLIWPMDPYYEQMAKGKKDYRSQFMARVRQYFTSPRTDELIPNGQVLPTHIYRGPGSVKPQNWGWKENSRLEPIISDYHQIYPWRPGFTRPTSIDEPWIVYNTPRVITDRIEKVYAVRYSERNGPDSNRSAVDGLQNALYDQRPTTVKSLTTPTATDWLYCFEGGTGAIEDKGKTRTYPVWSMMGFVLVEKDGSNYNLHIIFRGSRSGQLRPVEAFREKGNPDWVTDLDSTGLPTSQLSDPEISSKGKVNRGFRTSIKTMLPLIMECLKQIQRQTNKAPSKIYVSGHSLGGGLASHFTTAIKLGQYQPTRSSPTNLPPTIIDWPWDTMELVTFGAPTAGDTSFRKAFNQVMKKASRVYLAGDPVTFTLANTHIGRDEKITADIELSKEEAHSPDFIRRYLVRKVKNSDPGLIVPAPSGGEEKYEPWKQFASSGEMLSHLESLGYDLKDCLDKLAPQLITYLTLLQNLYLTASRKEKNQGYIQVYQDIRDIIANINLFNTDDQLDDTLRILWRRQPTNVRNILGDNMFDFIGICIILAYIGRNNIPAVGLSSWKSELQYADSFLKKT